ncbi:MAG: M20 family metallopeptidase [Ilumatobacteraceae bacterium]
MTADLESLVCVESPSRDLSALTASADVLVGIMERRLGTAGRLVPGEAGPHVWWQGGGEPRVLLVGHHDTVFPLGTLERRPFQVDGDVATGPGVFDMKAGIVQAIHAVASLGDRSGIEILITADEEVGSATSRDLIVERAQACGAVLVLEPSADGGALKTARKGTGTFEILIHGRAAHAGLEPEKGINALVEAAAQILVIDRLGAPEQGTTVTPTLATVGTADNVVPALARIVVDTRVVRADERDRVDTALRSLHPVHPEATIEVRGGFNRPPMPPQSSEWLFPLAQAAAEAAHLGVLEGVAVGGGSDGNFTAAAGVATLDGLGAVGGGAHADSEWVNVAAMPGRALLLAGVMTRLQSRCRCAWPQQLSGSASKLSPGDSVPADR